MASSPTMFIRWSSLRMSTRTVCVTALSEPAGSASWPARSRSAGDGGSIDSSAGGGVDGGGRSEVPRSDVVTEDRRAPRNFLDHHVVGAERADERRQVVARCHQEIELDGVRARRFTGRQIRDDLAVALGAAPSSPRAPCRSSPDRTARAAGKGAGPARCWCGADAPRTR